jgi:hypothetical protein
MRQLQGVPRQPFATDIFAIPSRRRGVSELSHVADTRATFLYGLPATRSRLRPGRRNWGHLRAYWRRPVDLAIPKGRYSWCRYLFRFCQASARCGQRVARLTIHSSRSRFAARLNSGVRPMTKLLPFLLLLALAGCSTAPLTETACLQKGGKMVGYTMFIRTCEWPATDAGKTCKDNRECLGLCELPDEFYTTPQATTDFGVSVQPARRMLIPKEGYPVTGLCSATQRDIKAPNCTAYVSDGKVALAGCAD